MSQGHTSRAIMVSVSDVDSWSDYLLVVQRIYNAQPNRTTGIAPARLLYGDAVSLDRQLSVHLPEQGGVITYEDYLVKLLEAYRKLVEASVQHQHKVVSAALAKAPDYVTVFEAGDMVLVMPAARPPQSKLQPRWLGPMTVVSLNTDKVKTILVGNHFVMP